jgi:PAS domain S-box-containing protein
VEAALRESRNQLQLFVRHAPAAIAMFDREMRYLAASERYLSDYHLSGQPVVGRGHYDLFPEMPERWKAIHRRCLAGEVARADADPFPRADGRTDWVRWEIRPWHDSGGQVGGLLLFSEVITALREMERQAARGERLEAIATLVRGMTHELNSPLASLITNVEFVRGGLRGAPAALRQAWDREAGLPVADLEDALGDAAGAAARVKAIVRDLSAFLPHPGGGTLRATLPAAVQKALRLAHHELVPCAAVRTELCEGRDVALAEDDLVQVLAALLVNAGQATGPGPNVVTVAARPAGQDAVEVEVSDTGVGMDAATMSHLFEPFFTTRPPGRGKGLGVPRCRAIAEAAGGELSYRSRPGQGTTARLLLPLVPAAAPGGPEAPPA